MERGEMEGVEETLVDCREESEVMAIVGWVEL